MYRVALETEKKLKAQQILKTLVLHVTSTTFQNKKLKCNANSAIEEVAL